MISIRYFVIGQTRKNLIFPTRQLYQYSEYILILHVPPPRHHNTSHTRLISSCMILCVYNHCTPSYNIISRPSYNCMVIYKVTSSFMYSKLFMCSPPSMMDHHNQRCVYGSNTCRSYWFYHQASFILQRYVGFKKTPQHQLSQDAFYILAAAERSDVLLGYDKNCIWRYCRLLQGQGAKEWTE